LDYLHTNKEHQRSNKFEERDHQGRTFEGLTLHDASRMNEGIIIFKVAVTKGLQNPSGMLHGGVAASLIDEVTTYALVIKDKESRFGVSVNLSCSYVSAGRPGETIYIEGKVLKVGKTLAFLEGVIRDEKGNVLVHAHHTKFVGNSAQLPEAKL